MKMLTLATVIAKANFQLWTFLFCIKRKAVFSVAAICVMAAGFSVHAEPSKSNPADKEKPSVNAEGSQEANVALAELGATAKGSGPACDRPWAWAASGALSSTRKGGGMLFGTPPDGIKGGRIDIRLIVPVDIKALEVVPLDYHGTIQPKAIDISIDGKMMKHVELENNPGEHPVRIPLEAHGQLVSVLITECYPPQTLPDGKQGAFSGGWSRVRVLSTTDVAAMMKPVDNYGVALSPLNVAPTAANDAGGKVDVVGEPRMTKGHPCLLWDNEDIAHYKEMLKKSTELQTQFAGLKKAMDIRITQPIGVPPPQKDADGKWMHLGDLKPFDGTTYSARNNQLSLDIANLGTVYALTGEAKYGEFCKQILLAYADAYPNYGVGARPGFAHSPSKLSDQTLGDAIWFPQVARGYDLIYNLPSITPEERQHIHQDLMKAVAQCIISNHALLEAPTNWSAIGTVSVLLAGYASDDEALINTALYGIKGTKEKPTGGLYLKHFSDALIGKDGLSTEGAMGYQFMALQALVMDAEVLWHHGVDMYRYRDCALKMLFDSPLQISYPDLTSPALHDSGHGSIINTDAFLYEYAYRRYRDPSYLLVLNQTGTHIDAHFQQFPVSVLYDRDLGEKVAPVEWKSVNFFTVGYGILRTTNAAATNSLLLEYGPRSSHGHPDKLAIDLYAFNTQLSVDPGSVWYEKPLYRQWFRTTLAHDTLVVDELDQIETGAEQLVYGSAETMGIQRAWTRTAYPGVTMDRALFLTNDYVADIFGAFARLPRKFDLAWHLLGDFGSDLQMEPMKFPEPMENGYVALSNVRHANTDKPWSASVTKKSNVARFVAAGGTPTEVIVGDGYYELVRPPTIIERRKTNSTVYGNAIDISGAKEGYVKGVSQEGGLDSGYGLLKIQTPIGTDLCFASYRPGTYKAGEVESDAQQAFVQRDGKQVRNMFLGGGKVLKVAGASLERSEPGLAYVEKTESGGFIVANPSAGSAEVKVEIPSLATMEAFNLDGKGRRTGAAPVTKSGANSVAVQLNAAAKVEFAPPGAVSQFDYREAMLRKRQADQEAALSKAREECIVRTKAAVEEAKAKPVPANTVLVAAAPAFSAQGGGEVNVTSTKRAAVGSVFSGWNSMGHWLEWTFDVPAEGYYHLTACYCSELDLIERQIQVNGEVQEPFAPMIFPSTGGWANGSDDWRLFTAMNPTNKEPLLIKLKQGKNVIRLTNMNDRGINVNYVAVSSPDVKATREMLVEKIKK